jgi:hypothetical protein
MRIVRFLSALVLGAALAAGSARAQDPPSAPSAVSREEQIRRIRQLPPEEQRRLKEALERFRALPPAEREALRRKAGEVGIERLGELAGRDFDRLHKKHEALQRELDEIMRLLGGPERLADLTEDERAYVRSEALRGFERHCRLRLLEGVGLAANFDTLLRAEKKERMDKALDAAFQRLLDELPVDEKSRILGLPARDQRQERVRLFAEWRLRETIPFVRKFESFRLLPLLQMPAEKRTALLAKRVRWFQVMTLLAADGGDPETMRMLRQLSPDERAQVSLVYEQSQDVAAPERRTRVEDKIRELYGKGSLDTDRPRRPFPVLRDLLRDRAQRERGGPKPR